MSRFSTVVPVMIYLYPDELSELKKYSKSVRKSVSKIVREGVSIRLAENDDPYSRGLMDGLNKAKELTQGTQASQMKFPSGKSFGDLVCDEIEKFYAERFSQQEKSE